MDRWSCQRSSSRYAALVAERSGAVQGRASHNPHHRCVYSGVADISVYIDRLRRGKESVPFYCGSWRKKRKKTVFTKGAVYLSLNHLGQGLYRKRGFREVGVFRNQGKLDGRFVDVMAMEKLL